jgi:hypothetical protein
MQKNSKKTRGILIISVLFLTIIIVMLATVIFSVVMIQQRNASAFYQRRAAEKIAQSGINYAMMRLEMDKTWRGYTLTKNNERSQKFHFKPSDIDDIEVYEHHIKDNLGFVEGKIKTGPYTGYFDLYFIKPDVKSTGEFIGKDAGSFPENIILSQNNSIFLKHGASDVYDFGDSPIPNKKVPPNSILLVCRGRVGNYTRIVETCFRLGPPGNMDAVVVGRGDVRVNIHGKENYDKIVLDDFLGSGPSIMRSVGSMFLGISPGISRDLDYLMVTGGSGGRTDTTTPNFSPRPISGSPNFRKEPGQANFIPKLEMDDVTPKDLKSSVQLNAGIYFIKPDPRNNNYPIVGYYRENSSSPILSMATVNLPKPDLDLTSEFRRHINNGTMEWNSKARKLTFLDSCKVNSVRRSGLGNINDISFISIDKERLTIQLGKENLTEDETPAYFINQNPGGNIIVDGQLSGSGTVICAGNLEMQAESQLYAPETTGVSIYVEGSVTVNEINNLPYLGEDSVLVEEYNTKQSIAKKINQFISEHPLRNTKYGIDIPIDVQIKLADGTYETYTPPELEHLADQHVIPVRYFSSEEQQYIMPIAVYNSRIGEMVIITDSSPKGYANRYIEPFYTLQNTEYQKALDFYGLKKGDNTITYYRVWGLNERFDISDQLETKYDFKGRPIHVKDSIFRGLVYSCSDFTVKTPNRSFILEGGLVAAGKSSGSGGNIKIDADDCRFTYNTKYLSLLSLAGMGKIKTIYWSSY